MENNFFIALSLILTALIGLSWFAGSDAPYVATAQEKIADLLKSSKLKKGTTFYELGSGDGRLVLEAARQGAESYGVEQSWLRVWYSRYQAWKQNLPNAHFFHGNLFDRAYFPADVVFIYLLPQGVNKLETKLKQELKKNSIVITQAFHFPNWKPYKKVLNKTKDDKIGGEFWFYKV
jgi:SAM-dependent methyltransferase